MAKIIFEPLDIVRYKDNNMIGMILPCGKVITFERFSQSQQTVHAEAVAPKGDEATLVTLNQLTAEMRVAFNFVHTAFCINSANSPKQTPS